MPLNISTNTLRSILQGIGIIEASYETDLELALDLSDSKYRGNDSMNNLIQLLRERNNEVIAEAMEALKRAHLKHYEAEGLEKTQQRLKKLFDFTLLSVVEKNVAPMIEHIENISRERFSRGYNLHEVQTAFNVLEEAIWNRILKELQPNTFAEALGLISTVLGIGKDTLARTYVSLASKNKTPYIDYKTLFEGFEGE